MRLRSDEGGNSLHSGTGFHAASFAKCSLTASAKSHVFISSSRAVERASSRWSPVDFARIDSSRCSSTRPPSPDLSPALIPGRRRSLTHILLVTRIPVALVTALRGPCSSPLCRGSAAPGRPARCTSHMVEHVHPIPNPPRPRSLSGHLRLRLLDHQSARLSRAELAELNSLKAWLWANTPNPPPEAYDDHRSRRPRTWFKPTATEHIRAAWRIADLLQRGQPIRPVQSRTLQILWEDDVQVVAREQRTPTIVRPPRPAPRPGRWNGDRTTIRRWPELRNARAPPPSSLRVQTHLHL